MTDPLKDGGLSDPTLDGGLSDPTKDGGLADAGGETQGAAPGRLVTRTPIGLVVITLDFCGRTFGVSPCLATGAKCYNTWGTCKYISAFLKQTIDYRFTSSDAPLPFDGVRPYISPGGVKLNPTEIRSGLAFDGTPLRTVSGRVVVEFEDEPDQDVGIDPYWSTRSSHPGTFWKKLLARNPNYKGRTIRYYEGFLGDAEGDFVLRWAGSLQNITLGKDRVKVEGGDLLSDFSKIDVPAKIDSKISADLASGTSAAVVVSSLEGIPETGWIRIDDEIIGYASLNQTTKQLVTLNRGMYGTTEADHSAKTKIGLVAVFGPKNPWDIWRDDLIKGYGDLENENIDMAAFSYWRGWPGGDIHFLSVVAEPVKLDKLVTELADLLDAKVWQDEQQRITVRRNVPNEPGREYFPLTDENNILHQSGSVDLNERSRLTRILIYWAKDPIKLEDDPASYGRLDIGVDADAEGDNGYDGVVEKKIYCRWISTSYIQEELAAQYVKNLAMRQVSQNRDARPVISFDLDLKDNSIRTGDFVKLTTDEILLPDGSPLPGHVYQLIKKDRKQDKIAVTFMKMSNRRVMFIAPAGLPAYESASEAEREYGFICQPDGKMADGSAGYYIW
jgi:hypothetical protein